MNLQENLQQLNVLKLHGMKKTYQSVMELPIDKQPAAHELLSLLLQSEIQQRQLQKSELLSKMAKLRYKASLDQIKCGPERNLNLESIQLLADTFFIKKTENILITGATGSGKSYLACAIGNQACIHGHKTLYLNMNRFIEKIAQSRLDGSFIRLLNQIEKVKLLILDDFGLQPMNQDTKIALLQILEDRYQLRSTIIASQLPVNLWFDYLNEPTLADAIMDRLTENAHRFELKGDSLRKKKLD